MSTISEGPATPVEQEAKEYQVALVLSVKAASYPDALRQAKQLAEGLGMDGENIYAETAYEEDNDGQRVLYLPPAE